MSEIARKYKNESLNKSKIISQYNQFILKKNLIEDYNNFIIKDFENNSPNNKYD